ncbi:sensor histidine kinase [Clostridium lundense]|uniref:sensor histidine kinase n=1 Tax=Clostridium lundense TaxID=319475 RepID=UPI000A7DEB30|nr:GHKL domain-containing protein [Clostridium lundense]
MMKEFTLSKLLKEMLYQPLSISILCCVAVYVLYKNKVDFKEIKKCFFISFMVGVVLRTGSYILILPLLSIIIIFQLKNSEKVESTIKMLMTIFVIYFINIFGVSFLGTNFYEKNTMLTQNYIIEFAIKLITVYLVCKIINIFFYKAKSFKEISPSQIRYRMILSIAIPIAISIRLIYPFLDMKNGDAVFFVIDRYIPEGIPLISIILILIIIYNYDKSVENEVHLKREIEEKYRIEEYAHMVEDMYKETRRFKHDYINMLTPLKEYIDGDNMKDLKKFFYNNVIDMDEDIKWNNSNIDKLRYIKITSLKAILSTKLIKALSINVDIKVDIVEDIYKVDINIMDLCRIIGILMDNAIEASKECEYPKFHLCVFNKGDYVVIAIHNNFFGPKPIIHKIYKEGFSTKGDGRGVGLYTVKNIIDKKYDNVFINTSIEDNLFIQELWIKNNEEAS